MFSGFLSIVLLELRALARSKTLVMLTVASVVWMLAFPHFVTGDGTAEGARELFVHYSLGGVFLLLVVALVSSAAGSLAAERTAKRLQLSLVRPVRYWAVALGRILAHVLVGALVLAIASSVLLFRVDVLRPCRHVLLPDLPSPRAEAQAMYGEFMKSAETPDEMKKASKDVVLRILTQRAIDNYQSIQTNAAAVWRFRLPEDARCLRGVAARLRFTNSFEMRRDLRGAFTLGGVETPVSNVTQSVLTIPLRSAGGLTTNRVELAFRNDGKHALMLRPRKDLALLLPADAFAANLARTYAELVSVLALLISFATLLSAGLGRAVAVFTAVVTLVVAAISPSVVEQYPDELEKNGVDRMGLAITRAAAEVTRPVSALKPLAALAADECVEAGEVVRVAVVDLLAVPVFFSLLAAFVLPRKQEDT